MESNVVSIGLYEKSVLDYTRAEEHMWRAFSTHINFLLFFLFHSSFGNSSELKNDFFVRSISSSKRWIVIEWPAVHGILPFISSNAYQIKTYMWINYGNISFTPPFLSVHSLQNSSHTLGQRQAEWNEFVSLAAREKNDHNSFSQFFYWFIFFYFPSASLRNDIDRELIGTYWAVGCSLVDWLVHW